MYWHLLRDVALNIRLVIDAFHVEAELLRDLSQHFLCQVTPLDSIVELDELDDVAGCLSTSIVSEQLVVRVELLHEVKLLAVAYANDHD